MYSISRIAKKPIVVPAGIECLLDGDKLTVSGKQASLDLVVHPFINLEFSDSNENKSIFIKINDSISKKDSKQAKAMTGTTRALVANMVFGISKGFIKELELVGVGYKAQLNGRTLLLNLGFSHPINFDLPEGIVCEVPKQTRIVLKSVDKQLLGEIASQIRRIRPPEPYKGKGVKYVDEVIRRKETKKK